MKRIKIFKTEEAIPTKLDVHAFHIISIEFYFLTPMDHGSKGKFLSNLKRSKSPKLERPCPSKLVSMHFTLTRLYLHEFFELILFFTPWSKREIWPNLEPSKKEHNLQNLRCCTHCPFISH